MSRIKRKKISLSDENNIITGMIISDDFLRDINLYFDYECLQNPISTTISNWCFDHYNNFQEAPKNTIQDIFLDHTKKDKIDPDHLDLIESFLSNLSDIHEKSDKFNHKFLLKKAQKYFSKQSLKNLSEDIRIHIKNGDIEKAQELQINYQPVQEVSVEGVNPYTNAELIRQAFEEDQKPLFKMKGALGQLVNGDLGRGSFVGILGSDKIGKTWWLMEFAVRAYKQRNNVAFFQAGDMTEVQQIRRMAIKQAKRSHKRKYCGNIELPVLDCILNQIDNCFEDHRTCGVAVQDDDYVICTECKNKKGFRNSFIPAIYKEKKHIKPLTWKEAYKINRKFDKRIKGKDFRISTHSSGTLTVDKVKTILTHWAKDGFVPDVIVLDYPDIMDEPGEKEFRHKEGTKWRKIRSLTQDYNCLGIVVTQADADAYGKKSLSRKNFSDDKRKNAHVTSFYSLNQTEYEESIGVIRFGMLFTRDDEKKKKFVTVIQNLQTGQAYIDSFWGEIKEEEVTE